MSDCPFPPPMSPQTRAHSARRIPPWATTSPRHSPASRPPLLPRFHAQTRFVRAGILFEHSPSPTYSAPNATVLPLTALPSPENSRSPSPRSAPSPPLLPYNFHPAA